MQKTNGKLAALAAAALAGLIAANASAQQAQPAAAAQATQDVPRTLDGHPDFTGVWSNYVAPGGRGGGQRRSR